MKRFILTLTALALASAPSFAEKARPFQDAMLRMLTETKTAQTFDRKPVPEADITAILRAGINAPSARNSQRWHFSAVTDRALLAEIAKDMAAMKPGAGPVKGAPGKGQGDRNGKPPIGRPSDNRVPGRDRLADDLAVGPAAVIVENAESGTTQADGLSRGAGTGAGIADAPLAIVVSRTGERDNDGFDAGLACAWMAIAAQTLDYGTKIVTSPTIALNGKRQAAYRQKLGIPDGMIIEAVLLVGSLPRRVDAESGASARNPYGDMVSRIK